jgi:hypothetical protein
VKATPAGGESQKGIDHAVIGRGARNRKYDGERSGPLQPVNNGGFPVRHTDDKNVGNMKRGPEPRHRKRDGISMRYRYGSKAVVPPPCS